MTRAQKTAPLVAGFILMLSGCGGWGVSGGDGEETADGEGRHDDGSQNTDGGACTSTSQCGGGLVCDPATGTCSSDVPCSTHSDCGNVAFCDGDGYCAPSTTGSPCDSGANCISGESCIGGRCGCEGEHYQAENVPPNLLIVLDRSTSMNDDIGGGTKWEIARAAIADILTAYGDQVYFGLMLYPGLDLPCDAGAECGPGTVFVDVGPATAAPINDAMSTAQTCSFGTPTAEALTALVDYAGLEDTTRANYILLVTDGQSTCDDPVPVVTALLAETPPVGTFVVGFGSSVDPDELDAMAQAGGTARSGGPPYYYQADDAAALSDAFTTIAGSVLSCSYTLSSVPADIGKLYVYFDNVEVPRDAAQVDGWDYDPSTNQVTFYGPSCDTLIAGQVGELVIVYGCPLLLG